MIRVRDILRDLGITYKEIGDNLRTACWNPDHKDKDPSMSVHLQTGIFHCFGCGLRGHILHLARTRLGLSYLESQKYQVAPVKEDKDEEQIFQELKSQMSKRLPTRKKPLQDIYIPPHTVAERNSYLENRGFVPDEIIKWGIGEVNSPKDAYHRWIIVPIYFNHILRTWFVRSPFENKKLYGFYRDKQGKAVGYKRSDILYGLDQIEDTSKSLYIVEGIFDKIWFDRTRSQTVASLGNRLLKEQLVSLSKFKRIVIVPDNDFGKKDEGLFLVESALLLLNAGVEILVCLLPSDKKDCNECSLEELLEATYKEVHVLNFIKGERYLTWLQTRLTHL